MTEPIHGPSPESHIHHIHAENIPQLAQHVQTQVSVLADQLQKLLDDPSLSTQESFLNEVHANAMQLNQNVQRAILC